PTSFELKRKNGALIELRQCRLTDIAPGLEPGSSISVESLIANQQPEWQLPFVKIVQLLPSAFCAIDEVCTVRHFYKVVEL
ncbi:MAG: hypothetical protein RIR34_1192, partial [Actinomycetota bacterium]